jgi:NADH dehydrogenase
MTWSGSSSLNLVGHQNRFNVFANWVYNYLTYDRHARLITDMQPSPAELANKSKSN